MVLSDTLIHKCNMSQTIYNYVLLHLIFLQHGYISISFCSKKRMWLCHHIHFVHHLIGVLFLQDLLFPLTGELWFLPLKCWQMPHWQLIEAEEHYVNFTQWFLNVVSNAPLSHLPPTYILLCTCTHVTHSLHGIVLIFRWSSDTDLQSSRWHMSWRGGDTDMHCDRRS